MSIVACNLCKKLFNKKPSQIIRSRINYCSAECSYKGRRKGKNVKCFMCGIEIYKTKKSLKNSKSGQSFCSRSCHLSWLAPRQREENHGNWKNGMFSYKEILKRDNRPKKCVLCKKEDKRILIVHHIDKNRNNNSLDNLSWLCHNCHFLIHHYKKSEDDFHNKNK